MKRIIGLLILLLALVTGLAFAVMNAGDVELNYYYGITTVPLSLALVVSLSVGAVLGVVSSMGLVLGLKRENAKLKRHIRSAEKELVNLRTVPLKDVH